MSFDNECSFQPNLPATVGFAHPVIMDGQIVAWAQDEDTALQLLAGAVIATLFRQQQKEPRDPVDPSGEAPAFGFTWWSRSGSA